jgi:hypothetical protein
MKTVTEFLWTGLGAIVMLSPFIVAWLLQRWNDNRVHYSTRELVDMQRNKINNYWWNR